jgi:hypothetical protein
VLIGEAIKGLTGKFLINDFSFPKEDELLTDLLPDNFLESLEH